MWHRVALYHLIKACMKDRAAREAMTRLRMVEQEIECKLNEELADLNQNVHGREIHTEYNRLKGELNKLETKIEEAEKLSSGFKQKLSKSSPACQRAVALVEQILKAEAKLEILRTRNSVCTLSPSEEKEALCSKICEDSIEITSAEMRSQEVEMGIKEIRGKLDEAEKTLCNLKAIHGGRVEKFLEMQQKEKIMQNFIDNHPIKSNEQKRLIQATQQKIDFLRRCIDQDRNGQLGGTSRQVPQIEAPDLEELQKVLELRRGEFMELNEIEEKTESEISKFSRADELRLQVERKYSALEIEKRNLEAKRAFLVEQIKDETKKLEGYQGILGGSELHSKLEDLNRKLISAEKCSTELQEEIEQKERELNYDPLLENVHFILGQLNSEIKNSLLQCPQLVKITI